MVSQATLVLTSFVLTAILFILVIIQQRVITSVQHELALLTASRDHASSRPTNTVSFMQRANPESFMISKSPTINSSPPFNAPDYSLEYANDQKQRKTTPLHSRKFPIGSVEFFLHTSSPANKPGITLTPEQEEDAAKYRADVGANYGGKGDPLHLGGFTDSDKYGISHNLWNFMLGPLAVRSFIDVGCGKGVSTSYFLKAGADVLCVEGSSDAIKQSLLPMNTIVHHDFSRGPWWPAHTYDVAWSVEFIEHLGRQYQENYMGIFKKSALIFVTSSAWGGFHHVEVHEDWWWRSRFQAQGFVLLGDLTEYVKSTARTEIVLNEDKSILDFGPQHIYTRMNVYVNPKVASLPRHRHLFGGNGCFNDVVDNRDNGLACGGVDKLPMDFESLLLCQKPTPHKDRWMESKWNCVPNPNINKTFFRKQEKP